MDPRAFANLLIVEIGNSHVSFAAVIGEQIRLQKRFNLDELDAAEEFAVQSWEALPDDRLRAIPVCSVVPDVLEDVRGRLERRLDAQLQVVGHELHRPMSLAVEHPEQVGIDRVCSAAAAYEVIGRACAVASFGTAITIDCVNAEGAFLGGSILPGLRLQAHALHDGTAALPFVDIEEARGAFGTNTTEAIANGIIYGIVGALREIVERFATELGTWPQLVVTGGNAELVSRHCDYIDSIVPDLCIRGVALAYRKHFAPLEEPSV